MIELDRDNLDNALRARLDITENARHRTMLERMLEHSVAERDGDLETLVGTLGTDVDYHFWDLAAGDIGPKTRDGVAAYYRHLVESNGHFLEFLCDRIVMDDHCVVIEGALSIIQPGTLMLEHPMAGGFAEAGKFYLMKLRSVIFWPFDEDLYIVGEDSYSGGPVEVRELADDELPLEYRRLLASMG